MEPELEDVVLKLAAIAAMRARVPLAIHDVERDVFVRRTGYEAKHGEFLMLAGWRQLESGQLRLVNQIRIEDLHYMCPNT
jgi:molybdopterin biosynthesis enzyme